MSKVSTYLNFAGNTEEVFNFYRSVFGGEFEGGIMRFGDTPPSDDTPEMTDSEKNMVMHVALPIMDGHFLMGTDACESMGFTLTFGNNVCITLHPDTKEETNRLFYALSEGGVVEMELQDMFWGDYYGSCADKYGVRWMFNCTETK